MEPKDDPTEEEVGGDKTTGKDELLDKDTDPLVQLGFATLSYIEPFNASMGCVKLFARMYWEQIDVSMLFVSNMCAL